MRSAEEIFEQIRGVLVRDFEIPQEKISRASHLVDDLDFDSIDAIDLAVRLEEAVGLTLDEDELKAIRTLEDIVRLVEAHVARAGAPPR